MAFQLCESKRIAQSKFKSAHSLGESPSRYPNASRCQFRKQKFVTRTWCALKVCIVGAKNGPKNGPMEGINARSQRGPSRFLRLLSPFLQSCHETPTRTSPTMPIEEARMKNGREAQLAPSSSQPTPSIILSVWSRIASDWWPSRSKPCIWQPR